MPDLTLPLDHSRPYVVTGAASGIGAAVVDLLSEHGATTVTVDLADQPRATVHVSGDVADPGTWEVVGRHVDETSTDGAAALITCAGAIHIGAVTTADPAEYERLFRINTLGVLHGLQRLVPAMAARGDGAVVAVASVDSLFAEDMMGAYATSKGALLQLIRSAAVEHTRHGVRINAVCPGAVDTPLLRHHLSSTGDETAARRRVENSTPAGRLLTTLEMARLLVFLSTPWASSMAGAAVVADGGLTATYDFRLDD
ncbi:SDR family NAD(P)-dependent oxidoreductase [Rhizohabitans arisaemae]|uniref:SDR family NAD(P)-dependent oxidoreductase n=1 Tax=Rhizohabitans arisaemae TaxID=2720610 RepID=UPI0024B144E0|nr:SDR family oxidoreductase [Rhizohabitans arisaemae]